MAKNKAIMIDRKSPDTALAQLATLINNINASLNKQGISFDDFVRIATSDIIDMAGMFDSSGFKASYLNELDGNVGDLGYIKESELSDWLTEHGYQPTEGE